jgi:hypothetical protein
VMERQNLGMIDNTMCQPSAFSYPRPRPAMGELLAGPLGEVPCAFVGRYAIHKCQITSL